MLFFLTPLVRVHHRRWLAKQSNAVAGRLADAVTGSLTLQVVQMGKAETRGYVRAKAMPVLQAELDQLNRGRPGLRAAVNATVLESLLDRIVQLVLDDVAHGRVQHRVHRLAA